MGGCGQDTRVAFLVGRSESTHPGAASFARSDARAQAVRTAMPRSTSRVRSGPAPPMPSPPTGHAAVEEIPRHGGDAVLQWPCLDREPLRPDRAGRPDTGLRSSEAACRNGQDPPVTSPGRPGNQRWVRTRVLTRPGSPQTHRGSLRLGQNRRWRGTDRPSRRRVRGLASQDKKGAKWWLEPKACDREEFRKAWHRPEAQ